MTFNNFAPKRSVKDTSNGKILSYKEFISIWKDTLDVLWKIAPIFFVPSGLFIWTYLKAINWTSIFYDSAMTGSGLIFLTLAALLMAFTIATMFTIPSLILIFTTQMYRSDKKISSEIESQYRAAWLGWLIGSIPFIIFHSGPPWLLLVPPIAFSSAIGLFIFFKFHKSFNNKKGKILKICELFSTSFLASFAMSGQIFPMWVCLTIFSQIQNPSDFDQYLFLAASIVLSLICITPGLMHLNLRTKQNDSIKIMKLPLAVALVIACMGLCVMAIMTPVSSMILSATGVFQANKKTFQILKPNVENVLLAAGIPVTKNNELTSVTTYVRFHFVGTRLLCKENFVFDNYFLLPKQKNIKPEENGEHCVPTKSDELREFRP